MASALLIILVFLSSTSGSRVHKGDHDPSGGSPSKKVVDFTLHIREAGEEYNEKIKVDPDKRTELFEVPAHPGVDRSDTFHDFKQKITIVRFPDSKNCYVFPLQREQSAPKKLIRDLGSAKQTVVTGTRRVDTTWITDSEVTDHSVLGDELAEFCAQYRIYFVKEAQESLEVIGMRTEGRSSRVRRQSEGGLENGTALCPGGMGLSEASESCSEPKLDCETEYSCSKIRKCRNVTRDNNANRDNNNVRDQRRRMLRPIFGRRHWRMGIFGFYGRYGRDTRSRSRRSVICWDVHTTRKVTVCCKYICNNSENSNNVEQEIFQRRYLRAG